MIKMTKGEVEALKEQREQRDLSVAEKLWDWFEQEQRIGMMQCFRTLVGHGLDYLYEFHSKYGKELPFIDGLTMDGFLKEECKGLDIWEGKAPSLLEFLKLKEKGAVWWNIGKCGGFFRMYGTFFEFFGYDKKTRKPRPTKIGNIYDEGVDSFKKHTVTETGDHKLPFGKYDARLQKRSPAELLMSEEQYKKSHPRARSGPATARVLPTAVQGLVRIDYGDSPGISLFKLLAWSTIRKIDHLYGLPEGADISGTTSDHLFGIYHTMYLMEEAVSKKGHAAPKSIKFPGGYSPADLQQINERKPLIILLPLAQMVREYHHTLLETAAALSLNDFIDYKIGFYTSLLAHDYARSYNKAGKLEYKVVPWRPTNVPLANTVRKLLEEADKAVTHMFCLSYTPSTLGNALAGYKVDLSKPGEIKYFTNYARLGVETYMKFYQLPENVTKTHLDLVTKVAGLEPPK